MMYFTANQNFGSERVLSLYRKEFETLDEMDNALISAWNRVVSRGDEVVVVGDFSEYSDYKTLSILDKLNGYKHLVVGNHDGFLRSGRVAERSAFSTIGSVLNLRHEQSGRWFYASHYPMFSWKGYENGTILVHGHIHTDGVDGEDKTALEDFDQGIVYLKRAYDVGADAHGRKPVSAEQIIKDVSKGKCTVLTRRHFISAEGRKK